MIARRLLSFGAFAVVLLALLLIARSTGSAQESAEVERGEFFDVVDVTVVNLDVYVTDENGDPVTGLTADDFEVTEDGTRVKITNFQAVTPESRAEKRAPRGAVPTPDAATTREEVVAPEQRLYLVVYIDNYNIMPFHRNRVFRRLREFLRDNVGVGDKVMLMTYDRSLERRVPFTTNETLVSSELFEIEEESGYGVHRQSDRRDTLRAINEAESMADALGRVETYAGSYYNDVMVSIDAMRDLISSLGGLPGRKAFLYVSDGLPQVAGEDMFLALQDKFTDTSTFLYSRQYDASRRFEELAALANTNRVTFYTIDAAGLRTMTSASVESAHAGTSTFVDSQNAQNLQAPLLTLAERTGGRAIINTNDVGPELTRIGEELESYYSLGYQPAHAGDGRYHSVEVKVKGHEDRRVRHRAGYRSRTLEQQMNDRTIAALRYGEEANRHDVDLRFGERRRREGGNVVVPIEIRFPLDSVTLIPQSRGRIHRAQLTVYVAAVDAEGNASEVQNAPLSIEIPDDELESAREKMWAYEVPLLMRVGSHRIAVGLRDQLAGTESIVTRRVRVRGG